MSANPIEIDQSTVTESSFTSSRIIAGLGAFGVALQNYPAVVLFLNSLTKNIVPVTQASTAAIHSAALATGGICSGVVNFWMNVELLQDFTKRLNNPDKRWQWQRLNLTTSGKAIYFGGILVFLVTGILFGLMAFTFAMEGPLAILSIAAGIFVAAIMTIQEIETWLQSYDKLEEIQNLKAQGITKIEPSLTNVQKLGKYCGHLIAIGNVGALSLLFALSLTSSLIAMHVAAFPALVTGFAIAFTFGAFTEYFFYNAYLADFCMNIQKNWQDMLAIQNAWKGIVCVSTNALVNAALTYAGVELLTSLLVAASIALPSATAMIALASICAFFAGAASLILGTAFWIRQNKPSQVSSHPMTMFGQTPAANESNIVQKEHCGNIGMDSHFRGNGKK